MVLTATWTLKKKKISDQSILTAKKVGERVSKKSSCKYKIYTCMDTNKNCIIYYTHRFLNFFPSRHIIITH